MFQVLSDTVDVVCTCHSSYVAHNPIPKNLLRASHLELPDCSCPEKKESLNYMVFSVNMSDVLMCDFYQGPGYSFLPLLTLDVYLIYGYIFNLGLHSFLYTDSFVVFFISSDTVSCLARRLLSKRGSNNQTIMTISCHCNL